ncbi:MAG: SpoIID/LytB domain-containing protein [Bacillota bacterium]
MRRAALWTAIILILVTAAYIRIPVYGASPQVVVRVALSVSLPLEFLLNQDACVLPLDSIQTAGDGIQVWRELECSDSESCISLTPSKKPYHVKVGDTPGEIVLRCPSGETISFSERLLILPTDHGSAAFQIGNRRYPGGLEISYKPSKSGSGEISIINLVDLEIYTEGVLAGEVYPSWESEALKAQAVATRTYALRRLMDNKSGDYDVDDTVLSQVYLGENGVEAFKNAVRETRGQVLVYDGVPIRAHYFSSGGGTTEGDEEVWLGGNDEPYLTARPDFDSISPYYRWEKPFTISADDLFRRIGLKPHNKGWIEPSIRLGDKVLAYRFHSGSNTVNLTREQIRQKLGLLSPRFHVTVRNGKGQEVVVDSRTELDLSEVVVFGGVGSGHGVGLSQWGAQGMALMCASDGTPMYDYVDILMHYYPGTELVDNYNIPTEPSYKGSEQPLQTVEDAHTGRINEDSSEDDIKVIEYIEFLVE